MIQTCTECSAPATWLLGALRVPYCGEHGAARAMRPDRYPDGSPRITWVGFDRDEEPDDV